MVDPKSLLERTMAAYAELTSYQDEGFVQHQFGLMPFMTFLKKPNCFRFEWIEIHPHGPLKSLRELHIVWSNDQGAFSYFGRRSEITKEESLARAVARATGVSYVAVETIVSLVMKLDGLSEADYRDFEAKGEQDFEGTPCHVIAGLHPRNRLPVELWIGTGDFLLRQIREPDTRTVRCQIRTNHELPDSTFAFTP